MSRSLMFVLTFLLSGWVLVACGFDGGGVEVPTPVPPARLSRVDAEPAGARCAGGGAAIHTGDDDDGDGVLDDGEIDDSSYVCEAETWQGDFLVEDWADAAKVAALGRARIVAGRLELAGAARVELPRLEAVTGDVRISPAVAEILLPRLMLVGGTLAPHRDARPTRWQLDALVSVGDHLVLSGLQSTELRLPALTRVGGHLQVGAATTRFAAPALEVVYGDLTIWGAIDAVDLPALTQVRGSLQIGSSTLRDLSGFPALTAIFETLTIRHPTALEWIDLPALQEVNGLVLPGYEPAPRLTSIALPALWSFQGELHLVNAAALTRVAIPHLDVDAVVLRGLPALRDLAVGGRVGAGGLTVADTGLAVLAPELAVRGPMVITGNPGLRQAAVAVSLDLWQLGSELSHRVADNPALEELELAGVVAGDVAVERNPRLRRLRLPGFRGGDLRVASAAISDLSALAGVPHASSIRLDDLPQLTSLDGAIGLGGVQELWIRGCHALRSVQGLPDQFTVQDHLVLQGNDTLADLSPLASWRFALHDHDNDGEIEGASIILDSLRSLTSLRGLEGVETIGNLTIMANPALTDLGALSGLRTVIDDLGITGNDALIDLDGLDGVTRISGSVYLSQNPALRSTAGLDALRAIGGVLWISRNPQLEDLDGFAALTSVGGEVRVSANPELPQAAIDELLARVGRK